MKNLVIALALFVLTGLPGSPWAETPTSPSLAASGHVCRIYDYEKWRREHPPPAGKGLGGANVGEPRTVRMIYFLPNDRPFRQEVVDSMKVRILQAQSFFAEQMEAHGYGRKTFRIETDPQGEPVVHRVDGEYSDDYYRFEAGSHFASRQEVYRAFLLEGNVLALVMDTGHETLWPGVLGWGEGGRDGGTAAVTDDLDRKLLAHELGHAFGILHDFRDGAYIMSYGPGQDRLSACNAGFLSVHPYFDPSIPEEGTGGPHIELVSSTVYPLNAESVSIQAKFSDWDGLHQVRFNAGRGLKSCKALEGAKEAIAEFEYDGISSASGDPRGDRIWIEAVDSYGSPAREFYTLQEDPVPPRPVALAIVSGDRQQGATGTTLSQPLVVVVRDQYGDPVPDTPVSFRITLGAGKLSGRYAVENIRSGGDGRAKVVLTLGPDPGRNTVGVFLGGRELVAFRAEGLETSVAALEGDYRSWRLPQGATVRLGKGVLGKGDKAVALSVDGRCLAVASTIGVWLYEVATSRTLALLPSGGPVHSVALSFAGTLAAGLASGEVELWDVETGERTSHLKHGNGGRVSSLVFSTDGVLLASGARDEVNLWDVAARQRMASLEGHTGSVFSVSFSPDGTYLVSGSRDGEIKLWDVATGEEVATLESPDPITSLAFSPDGATVASAGSNRTVRLWDLATQTQSASLSSQSYRVLSLSFGSPDGGILAVGNVDGTVTLWDVATQEVAANLEGHGGAVHSVAFSSDGATLLSAAVDGKVRLRDMETGSVAVFSGHRSLSAMAVAPTRSLLAWGYPDGSVALWDLRTRRREAVLEGHRHDVNSVSFSPDGGLLAVGSPGEVALWHITTRKRIATLEGHRRWVHREGGSTGYSSQVPSLSFSSDGTLLASGALDSTVILWDARKREQVATLETPAGVRSVSFSPDGSLLAAGDREGTVILWDVGTRGRIATLEGHSSEVNAVLFSPDGRTLASGSWDRTIRLWDVARHSHIATLEDWSWIHSVAFSPDGTHLLSGSRNRMTLWDVATGEVTTTLEGHNGKVLSVAFSSGGTTVVSGSEDGTILVWDLLPRPRALTMVPANGQQGPAGDALAEPLVVLVRDQYGAALAGATVTFSVKAGGGRLSVETTTTDAHGRAASTLTLGSQPGPNHVEVTVDGLEPVTFTAVGLAVARTVDKLSGDEQQGPAGDALDEPFVVEVSDQNGNALAGTQVTFAVTNGEGTLSVTRATTDAQGRATTTLTLGRTPGATSVEVTVAGLAPVTFTALGVAIPQTLTRLSGDEQAAEPGEQLPEPLVVSVRDQNGTAYPGAVVTFALTGDGGTLSALSDTTDAEGQAATTLTLGDEYGTYTVVATVADLEPVTFAATAKASPDFDDDGEVGFGDFFLFAEAFGGSDPRFDLDGSGSVDFADFFLFAENFGQPARAKLVALAREMIGLPEGPQLRQNAPNPFNSGTVISWFQLQSGPARLEVFAVTGQRVAVLHEGPRKAGLHRLRWDGRDDQGRQLGSGVYVYRLVTAEAVQTRKLTLLR